MPAERAKEVASPKHNRILMIDDNESLVGIMSIKLQHAGYRVDSATVSSEGYTMAIERSYDLVILDVTMPGLSGYEICRDLRAHGVLTPILMLSGVTEKPSIVQSLELGADDYLTKPFNHNELMARLQALVRRNKKSFASQKLAQGGLGLDVENGTITYNGNTAQLTRKEALLLRRLMYEAPEPVARDALLKDVWEIGDMHTSNRLDVYVRRLRAKLESIDAADFVQTLRGKGYYFAGPGDKE